MRILRPAAFVALLLVAIPSVALAIVARDYTQTFHAHRPELLSCAGSREGSVTIQLQIAHDGRVGWNRVASAEPAAMRSVGECVLERARQWQFERSSSGAWRSYSLYFANGQVTMRTTNDPIPSPPAR